MNLKLKNPKSMVYVYISFVFALFAVSGQLISYILPNAIFKFIVVASVLLLLLSKMRSIRISKSEVAPVVLLFVMGILVFYNDDWWNIYDISIYCATLLLCLFSFINGKWISYYFKFSIVAYFIYALFTIFTYLNPDFYINNVVVLFPNSRNRLLTWYNQGCMAGLTDHYSTNAMFLSVGLTILVCYIISIKNKRKKMGKYYFALLIILVALLLTGKRGQVVFSFIALFAVYYISLKSKGTVKRFIKIIGFIIVFLGLFFIAWQLFPELFVFMERFTQSIDNDNLTSNRSKLLWPLAINAFKSSPIFGLGWCQYTSTISTQIIGESSNYHAHNIYLQLLCDTGIFGFGIYVAWILINLVSTYKIYNKVLGNSVIDSKIKFYIAFALAFQIYFIFYGLTGNPLYDEEMFIPYYVSCAISIYYRNNYDLILSNNNC